MLLMMVIMMTISDNCCTNGIWLRNSFKSLASLSLKLTSPLPLSRSTCDIHDDNDDDYQSHHPRYLSYRHHLYKVYAASKIIE